MPRVDPLGYVTVFAVIGLVIGVRLLQSAIPEERHSDTRLLVVAIGAISIAILAGIVVGSLLR